MGKLVDMTGERTGKLLVLSREPNKESDTRARWLCLCDCGNEVVVDGKSLRNGSTKSCGCLRNETKTNLSHAMSKTRFYRIWAGMKKRCNNPKEYAYKWYGAKGITYDDYWEVFDGFYKDMFETYKDDLTIDRIDPHKNYCKENCRWIPLSQQARGKTKREDNKTGVTGVFFETYIQKGHEYSRYSAHWITLDWKHKTKCFACKKYGHEEAFLLACEYRNKVVEELNTQGAGYTEAHGK